MDVDMGEPPTGSFANLVKWWDRKITTPEDELIAKAAIFGTRFEAYKNVCGSFIRARNGDEDFGGWLTYKRAAIAALLRLDQFKD